MKHLLALLLLLASPAMAATDNWPLYVAGKYREAMRAGDTENSAPALVIAARAALADANLRDMPCLACLQEAEGFARRAIEKDSRLPDGHTYLAVSLGYQARIIGMVGARVKNYPRRARDELTLALAADADNAWALAALGGWHIEIVRTAGAMLARMMMGASVEAGEASFARAFRVMPGNAALRYQYGLSLSGLDRVKYRAVIEDAFQRAVAATPLTAYEKAVQGRARLLLQALARNDAAGFDALVHRYQGYP